MRMAKASESDINTLREFLMKLEELAEEDFLEALTKEARRVPTGWRRVVEGYVVLVDNVCDPDKNYLDFKPELAALLEPRPQPQPKEGDAVLGGDRT